MLFPNVPSPASRSFRPCHSASSVYDISFSKHLSPSSFDLFLALSWGQRQKPDGTPNIKKWLQSGFDNLACPVTLTFLTLRKSSGDIYYNGAEPLQWGLTACYCLMRPCLQTERSPDSCAVSSSWTLEPGKVWWWVHHEQIRFSLSSSGKYSSTVNSF